MDRVEKIVSCFKEVGVSLRIDRFENRLIIQKAVFLLELIGMKFDYNFSLYVRGPYSPDLASELYAHEGKLHNMKPCPLSESEKEKITRVYELSNEFEPKILEIMATYLFIWKVKGESVNEALIHLKKLKPYPETQIVIGVSRAKQLLPPTENEIREMKAEFKAWEDVSDSDAVY